MIKTLCIPALAQTSSMLLLLLLLLLLGETHTHDDDQGTRSCMSSDEREGLLRGLMISICSNSVLLAEAFP